MTRMEELLKQQEEIVAAIAAEYKRGQESAAKGESEAQYNLAVMYHKGQGVAQNFAEAVTCYKLAAEQGNADAQYNLGDMTEKGQGTAQDYAEAVHWLQLAAAQGHSQAQ